MSEITRITDQLKRALYGDAWHGPAVLEALDGFDAKTAQAKPIPSAHSAWEITLHVTSWFRIMKTRFEGEDPEITRSLDWPPIADPSAKGWTAAIADLKRAHREFQQVIDATSESELFVELPARGYDLYFVLHGMIQHCVYHAGQIALLKKSIS